MYKTLRKIYHINSVDYHNLYQERFNSNYSIHLGVKIHDNEAFFLVTPEMQDKLYKIQLLDKNNWILAGKLPNSAIEQLKNKLIIDEVTTTNDIESINSSRREISNILHNTQSKKNVKFYDLVKTYETLWNKESLNIKTCKDIRNLYDNLVLQDVLKESKKNKPDGVLFRKDSVEIWNHGKKIHEGLMPEEKIISSFESALNCLNDQNINRLLRIAAFHYLFGYIHPFYDGNGRLNRFISSYMISDELHPLVSYRLSYTINNNLSCYYKAFTECNHPLNCGDITFFVDFFIDILLESVMSLNEVLNDKLIAFENYSAKIYSMPELSNKHLSKLSYYLMQSELFSEDGISRDELLKLTETTTLTLRKRLKALSENNLLNENLIGKWKYYSLNIDTLDKITNNQLNNEK